MKFKKIRYIRISDFTTYFFRDRETGLFICKICLKEGTEIKCANRTRHMGQQHRPIYLKKKEELRKERELYEIELWKRTSEHTTTEMK